jgi:hypothetical protein
MPTHRHTFDSAHRAVELLLSAQLASPHPLEIQRYSDLWGVSRQTVRRIARVVEQQVAKLPSVGRVERRGQGLRATLTWLPRRGRGTKAARSSHLAPLLAALEGWRIPGSEGVTDVLEHLVASALEESGTAQRSHIARLVRRGFYHQPSTHRPMRDPEALDNVLSALYRQRGLRIGKYRSPRSERLDLLLEPWTLVRSLDGLYLLAPRAGSTEPRMWALHRMEATCFERHHVVEVPTDYKPEDYLSHGYGPFLRQPGSVTLRVPAHEAPWVLEAPLPHQLGEPEPQADGSVLVKLDIGWTFGLELWARGMGVEIEDRAEP